MKKTNKSEFTMWFIPVLFAYIGSKVLFNFFNFKYNFLTDGFDIAKLMIDLGVFLVLCYSCLMVIRFLKK
tara:strand:+ start:37 stop:246 length:210 start_codon:yes stop_codon:yes gene_type:complete